MHLNETEMKSAHHSSLTTAKDESRFAGSEVRATTDNKKKNYCRTLRTSSFTVIPFFPLYCHLSSIPSSIFSSNQNASLIGRFHVSPVTKSLSPRFLKWVTTHSHHPDTQFTLWKFCVKIEFIPTMQTSLTYVVWYEDLIYWLVSFLGKSTATLITFVAHTFVDNNTTTLVLHH